MMKTGNIYKIILSGIVYVLSGCQASNIDVTGIQSNPDMIQNLAANQLYEKGKVAFKNNDMIQALKFFKAAYSQDPHEVRTLNGLGSVYDHLRRFDLAQNYYYRALRLDPLSSATLNNLGYSHLLQNKPLIAVEYFRKAYRVDPFDVYVQHNLMIAEQKTATVSAPLQVTKLLSEKINPALKKYQHVTLVKVTSKIQQLKVPSAPQQDISLISPKRSIGYQLILIDEKENYTDYISGAEKVTLEPEKVVQKPEVYKAPVIFTASDNIVYVSRPPEKKQIILAKPLLEISNGAGRRGMAARMKKHMEMGDVAVQRLTNADHYSHMTSRIYYRPGWEEDVRQLASLLPIAVSIEETQGQIADIRLEIGGDLLAYDVELIKQFRRNANHEGKKMD